MRSRPIPRWSRWPWSASPTSVWGEVPKAYVVLREGADVSIDDLREFAGTRLARHKVPKVFEVVRRRFRRRRPARCRSTSCASRRGVAGREAARERSRPVRPHRPGRDRDGRRDRPRAGRWRSALAEPRRERDGVRAKRRALRRGGAGARPAPTASPATGRRATSSSPDDVARLVDETQAAFGRIDILVNNAGTAWGAAPESNAAARMAEGDRHERHRRSSCAHRPSGG